VSRWRDWWVAVEFGIGGFAVFLDGRTNRWRNNDGTRLSFGLMIGRRD
jgi:hypothetical protein